MHIDEDALKEFIELWKREFSEELSEDQARYHVSLLLELYWLLYAGSDDAPPTPPAK